MASMSSAKAYRDKRHAADEKHAGDTIAGRSHHRVFVGQELPTPTTNGATDEAKSKAGANGPGVDRKHHCPKHSTKQRVFRAIVMPASELDGNSEFSSLPRNVKDIAGKSVPSLSTPRSCDTKEGPATGEHSNASIHAGRAKRSGRAVPEHRENNARQTPMEVRRRMPRDDASEPTDSDSASDSAPWAPVDVGGGSDADDRDTRPDSVLPARGNHRSLSSKGNVRNEVDARVRALTQEAARLREKLEASEAKRRRCVSRAAELEEKLAERDASITQLRFTNQSLQKELSAVAEASAATSRRNRAALASLRSGLSAVESTVATRSAYGSQLLQALVAKLLGLQTLLLSSAPLLAGREGPPSFFPADLASAGDRGAKPGVLPQVQALLTGILQNVSQLNGVVTSGLSSLSTGNATVNVATADADQLLHDFNSAAGAPTSGAKDDNVNSTQWTKTKSPSGGAGYAGPDSGILGQVQWQTPVPRPERDGRGVSAAAAASSRGAWQNSPATSPPYRVRNDHGGAAQEHSYAVADESSQHQARNDGSQYARGHKGWGHDASRDAGYDAGGKGGGLEGQSWSTSGGSGGQPWAPSCGIPGRDARDREPATPSSSQATFWPSVQPGRQNDGADFVPSAAPGMPKTPQQPEGLPFSTMPGGGAGNSGGGGGITADEPMILQLMAQLEQSEAERDRLRRLLDAAQRAGDLQGAQVASLIPMYSQAIEKARALCASLQAKLTSGMKERRALREQLDAMEAELKDRDAQAELRRVASEQREAAHLRVATDAQMRAQDLEVQLQEMRQRIHNGVDAYRALSAEHAAAQAHTVELQLKIDELQATIVEMQATIDDLRADLKSVLDMVALKKVRAAANAVSSLSLTPNTSPSKLPTQQASPGLATGTVPQPQTQWLPGSLPGVGNASYMGFTPVKGPTGDTPGATSVEPIPLAGWDPPRSSAPPLAAPTAPPVSGEAHSRRNLAFGRFPGSGPPGQNHGADASRLDNASIGGRPGRETLSNAIMHAQAGTAGAADRPGQISGQNGYVEDRGSQAHLQGQKFPSSSADVILGQLHLDMAALDAEMTALQHSLAR